MTTTQSADSDSAELTGSTFLSDRVVTSFPRHDVVNGSNRSDLFFAATVCLACLTAPTRFIQSSDGGLVANPAVLVFDQQDSLLTSWLLSTISPSFLSSFTDVRTAHDVWLMANSLFAADSSTKQSQLRHELHSLRKGSPSVRSYVNKITSLCALLAASGSHISEAERSAVLLVGLSSDFDSIVSTASLSSSPLPFQRLVDALIECEARQARSVQEVLVAANTVEGQSFSSLDSSLRGGGQFSARGRGRSFRSRIQCQICSRFGHLAQRCYYHYHRDEPSPADVSVPRRGGFVNDSNRRDDERMKEMRFGQNWGIAGQNWRPWPNCVGTSWVPRETHVGAGSYGVNPFVPRGDGLPFNVDQPLYDNWHAVGPNQYAMGINHGHSSSQMARQPRGPSGPIKARPHDGTCVPEPSANCVGVDRSWQTVHEAPWRTKPRARVFSVDSSPYPSSQFVGLPPRVPELHVSDYSDSTHYDSNFNATNSYVPLPVGNASWCPDSGATHHVCRNDSDLHGSTPYSGNSSLLMGNGVSTRITSVGNAVIPTPQKLLHLSNVLCVPSIRKNLLSVSKFATDNNVFFEFHPSYCVIKDIQTREILLRGQVRDGLYHFSASSSSLTPSVNSATFQDCSPNTDVFSLWHKRLGHPADTVVKNVLASCQISCNKSHLTGVCVACQQGKSHKLPFSQSNTKYVGLFELVVSDLWGPAAIPCEGNLYYVSFIDMTSRFTWIYLIRQKSQAIECFSQFQKMVFTQFGKHIKQFQSDWGGEFRAFSSVLANQGILHRVSCPYTSEQNGVAERKHRHVVETGITLLAQANLPMDYWGYAFCSATHLINRLPTSVLDGKTPFQCLFNRAPSYDHLRVFCCCCCFSYLRPFGSHKLEFRSQPSTFLGYSPNHKGYFCLTPDGKVIVSRHVMFDENKFLSSLPPNSSDQLPLNTTTYVPVVRSCNSNKNRPDSVVETSVGSSNGVQSNFPATGSVSPQSSTSRSADREEVPSTVVSPTAPPDVSLVSVINTHAMVTRSKAGIFKPRALCTNKVEVEPRTVEEALSHPDWRLAVQAEFDALLANSTWVLCPLPSGRKAIGCKWLFKIKKNPDGTISRRKARLVAKGCSQVPGCDFKETFSPVVKPVTIRLILSVAVTKGWHIRQVDVNNAFLNGDLTDDVFMHQPPGYEQFGPNGERLVCQLTKALYGLRQAPRAWFDKLKQFLVSAGFTVSKSDASLFVRLSSDHTVYVLVYVDDIVITGSSVDEINCFVQMLHNQFALKDMGELHYFLGIEVSKSSSGSIHLCQRKYIRELLTRSSMANARSVHTPMITSSQLSKDEGEPLADPTEYRSIAGALQYIVLTRPNIAYAVNRVCQFMHAPTTLHMVALKHILRYLSGTLSHGLVFCKSDRLSLVGYADANWGLDFDDRRSTTGYFVYYGDNPISWCSKKQQVVSRSTAEAEYQSLAAAASDVTWLVSLLTELNLSSVDLPTVWCDNSSAVAVAANPVLHSKFKHVELDLFFVREMVARGELVVSEVPACDQVADVLTKPLSASMFTQFCRRLRVVPLEEVR
ncbi:hypothetical protein CXB51_003840 [Gossypium anomalum]|uniref:Integrase catalytic domain-containing protein n=1 Tax=Gossypium anomalum TaxID=47600 RepID=A0A8J6DAG0_9ROSI|nr:hypothetical protein CXB51_003840 [Gossypium anomalum]